MAIEIKEVSAEGIEEVAIVDCPATVTRNLASLESDVFDYITFDQVPLNGKFIAEVIDGVSRNNVFSHISGRHFQREKIKGLRGFSSTTRVNRWIIAFFRNRELPVIVPIMGVWSPDQVVENAELHMFGHASVKINGHTEIPGFPFAQDARLIINELVERHAAARK